MISKPVESRVAVFESSLESLVTSPETNLFLHRLELSHYAKFFHQSFLLAFCNQCAALIYTLVSCMRSLLLKGRKLTAK